jgi:sporulation protein YlmC with PRC-barrel domain
MKRWIPLFSLFALGFGLAAFQPAGAGIRVVPDPDLKAGGGGGGAAIRTSQLIDGVVRDHQGQDLGQVQDVVMDKNGRVAYILLSGNESTTGELIPVPFTRVRFDRHEKGLVLSNMDKARLEKAPSIRKEEWSKLDDPAFEKQVFRYHGEALPEKLSR